MMLVYIYIYEFAEQENRPLCKLENVFGLVLNDGFPRSPFIKRIHAFIKYDLKYIRINWSG